MMYLMNACSWIMLLFRSIGGRKVIGALGVNFYVNP